MSCFAASGRDADGRAFDEESGTVDVGVRFLRLKKAKRGFGRGRVAADGTSVLVFGVDIEGTGMEDVACVVSARGGIAIGVGVVVLVGASAEVEVGGYESPDSEGTIAGDGVDSGAAIGGEVFASGEFTFSTPALGSGAGMYSTNGILSTSFCGIFGVSGFM